MINNNVISFRDYVFLCVFFYGPLHRHHLAGPIGYLKFLEPCSTLTESI